MLVQKIFEKLNWKVLNQFNRFSENPEQIQKDLLFRILSDNKNCEYGLEFGFNEISSVEEFQKRVPMVRYQDLESRIERMKNGEINVLTSRNVIYFVTTSGSTNIPKFIPITKERRKTFNDEFNLWAIFALRDHPKVIEGKSLLLTGSNYDGKTEAGTSYGSISGYLAKNISLYFKTRLAVPFDVYNIQNFDEKIHVIARLGLENNISQLFVTSPIEVPLLLDYIEQNRKKITKEIYDRGNKQRARDLDGIPNFKPKNYWPNLSLITCVKGGFAQFYLDRVRRKVGPDIAIRDIGIYSSEGRVSICLSDEEAKGVIAAGSNFFEFIELNKDSSEKPITIRDLKKGRKYSILITTPEGLYRYDLGDIVKVVDFHKSLPIIEFVDRKDKELSMVGEHVSESELVKSVKEAAKKEKINLVSFTAVPNIDGYKPRYEFLIETERRISEKQAYNLLAKIEKELQNRSFVYKKTRKDYGRLNPPLLSIIKKGSYNKLDEMRIQAKGIRQIKPINLSQDLKFKEKFQIEDTYSL